MSGRHEESYSCLVLLYSGVDNGEGVYASPEKLLRHFERLYGVADDNGNYRAVGAQTRVKSKGLDAL